jgi:quinoprotein glucose dehydrogenase
MSDPDAGLDLPHASRRRRADRSRLRRPAAGMRRRRRGSPAGAPVPSAAERAQASAEGVAPRRRTSRFGPSEATPVMVDGLLYMTTPYRKVVALRPETGEAVWTYDMTTRRRALGARRRILARRRQGPPRIVFGTRDAKLIALDAVDRQAGGGLRRRRHRRHAHARGPERHRRIAGHDLAADRLRQSDHHRLQHPGAADQGRGGRHPRLGRCTGKLVWTFHTVPRKGEFGYDTWKGDSTKQRSGVNVWTFMTVDEAKTGVVYAPLGAPAWDRYGGDRKGANLYANSWWRSTPRPASACGTTRTVHHDIWDHDLPAQPVLFDVKRGGKTIPAVGIDQQERPAVHPRPRNGKPVYAVKETPVPRARCRPRSPGRPSRSPSAPPPDLAITSMAKDLVRPDARAEGLLRKAVADEKLLGSAHVRAADRRRPA